MITAKIENHLVNVAVLGEFSLTDFKEFEEAVAAGLQGNAAVNVLVDLRDMIGFTVDVAWEDLKFSRQHLRDFRRMAIVTEDQWITWSAWLSNLFVQAAVQVFKDYDEALSWVSAP